MEQIHQKLESVFRHIHQERMHDMPLCNPVLQVQAIGFQEWGDYYLGVMITPWFMNLMLLPTQPDGFANRQEGSKQLHIFPSGRYEFITGREEGLGSYQMCSLFSPMQDFTDQDTTVETANLVLDELMKVSSKETSEAASKDAKPDQNQPMSRRDFLRGRRQPNMEAQSDD